MSHLKMWYGLLFIFTMSNARTFENRDAITIKPIILDENDISYKKDFTVTKSWRSCPICPMTGTAQFCNICANQDIVACGTITALGGFSGPNSGGGSGRGPTGATGATGICICTGAGVTGATGPTGAAGVTGPTGVCTCSGGGGIGTGPVHITDKTQSNGFCIVGSTSTTGFSGATGALIVDGGVAIGGNLNVAGSINTCQNFQIDNLPVLSDFVQTPNNPHNNYRTLSLGFHAGQAVQPPSTVSANTFLGNFAGQYTTHGQAPSFLGAYNTFVGDAAGQYNVLGFDNTAVGADALAYNINGAHNVALGFASLLLGTGVEGNTVVGVYAMADTPGAIANIAIGQFALEFGYEPDSNIAIGNRAMRHSAPGVTQNIGIGEETLFYAYGARNIAIGHYAQQTVSDGAYNVSVGVGSLNKNIAGNSNVSIGTNSLFYNQDSYNVAVGLSAGVRHYAGQNNVFLGSRAGRHCYTGSYNVFLGARAGEYVVGSSNIHIGLPGFTANETGRIRIGIPNSHTGCYIAGIVGNGPFTDTVMIDPATHQLGTNASSRRFKDDIMNMPDQTEKVMSLRPVNFHFKSDANQRLQYGLIAEEVHEIYPELVSHDGQGDIYSVNYQALIPVLLAQVQRLEKENNDTKKSIKALEKFVAFHEDV